MAADEYAVNVGAPRPFIGRGSLVRTQGTTALAGLGRSLPFGPGAGREASRVGPFNVSGITG